ncbi:MAG: LysR family transcriptional regulator [Betaproteobacteria bacterium]
MADHLPDRIRRLRSHDLNLLTGLYVLLERASVTDAARELGLTQSAMSKMLDRLRDDFGDRLLVRTGNRMVLTSAAQLLLPELARALNGLGAVYSPAGRFDPRRVERTLSIGMNEFLQYVLGPGIIGLLREKAPQVSLRLRPIHSGQAQADVMRGDIDLLIGAAGVEFKLRSSILYRDKFACLACADNLALQDPLPLADFAKLQQVYVSPSGFDFFPAVIHQFLGSVGRRPRPTDITLSSYFAASRSIVGTDRVTLLPNRLIASFVDRQVRVVPLAFDPPDYNVALWWHTSVHDDPFFVWFRHELHALVQQMPWGSALAGRR